jgi:hypothetical protein
MSRRRTDSKGRLLLAFLVLAGGGMLSIPFFLTPPAYLDLVLHDTVFASDLTSRQAVVSQDSTGKRFTTLVRRVGNDYVARVGRVDSGAGAYSVQLDGFRNALAKIDAAPLQTVRAGVGLTPAFGRLEITPVNALVSSQPVAATAREGSRALVSEPRQVITVDLPPGKHRISAQAPGFCGTEREFDVREGKVTAVRFPLSPDLAGDEVARFVLHWDREPRDLDAHFRKLGTTGMRNPEHAFFSHKEAVGAGGVQLARLDVDERQPQGYETTTVLASAQGDYEYYVHLFAGQGTIGGAGATVQVYTKGCTVKTFSAPPGCDQSIWNVANVRNSGERVELLDRQRCEPGAPLLLGGKAPLNLQ